MAKIEIEKAELNELLRQNEELKADFMALRGGVIKIMDFMGLIDPKTQGIKAEIESGEESFVPGMIKSLGNLTVMLAKASTPFVGVKAKEELGQKFIFIHELIPLINKHQ